jgi:8-oxo-dGDP phosphatase
VTGEAVRGEFRLVSSTLLYEGPIFRLVNDEIAAPDGATFCRQIIRHSGAVAVVPLHDDGSVTVVRQYRASVAERLMEIPAGLLDFPGESLEEAARRELREEVGLTCTHLDHLCTYLAAPGLTDERVAIFVARGLSEVDDERHGPEEDDLVVERVAMADVLRLIERGELVDGKTAYALALLVAKGH